MTDNFPVMQVACPLMIACMPRGPQGDIRTMLSGPGGMTADEYARILSLLCRDVASAFDEAEEDIVDLIRQDVFRRKAENLEVTNES